MVTRPLTDGEIALAKEVYGESIDYSEVKIHSDRYYVFQPKGMSMSPNGELYMYGTYMDDYTTGNPHQRSLFIHEMGHVWQIQNKVLNLVEAAVDIHIKHSFNYKAGYYYLLESGKDLTEYNMEQQASIIEDYFMLKHENVWPYQGTCKNECDLEERLALYEKVLEKFLENPSYAKRDHYLQKPGRERGENKRDRKRDDDNDADKKPPKPKKPRWPFK